MSLEKFEDLNKFITILIIDDEESVRNSLQIALNQEGYQDVWALDKVDDADKYLDKTNILLADYKLPNSKIDGILLTKEAKLKYGDKLEVIVFSAEQGDNIKNAAIDAQAAAFIEKPVRVDHIKLWIKELGKRIWLQQILDTAPDETIIKDRSGTILYSNETKMKIFGNEIIGKKCYRTFEDRLPGDDICFGCASAKAFDEERTVRTVWEYKTRADISKHKIHQINQTVDIVASPLYDIQNKQRAIIEISRDITMQKMADKLIDNMEKEMHWRERRRIFIDGFLKIGFKRARLYLRDKRDGKDEFKMMNYRGEYKPPLEENRIYSLEKDIPTQLIIDKRKPLYFKSDQENKDQSYKKDDTISGFYWVGENNILDYDILKKDEWIDIPLIAEGEIIGKVSIDGWSIEDRPDNYDLEILGRYSTSGGQLIHNARVRRVVEQKEKIENVILKISREITNMTIKEVLLRNAAKYICETMETSMCSIFLFDNETEKLEMEMSWGKNKNGDVLRESEFYKESYRLGEYLTGKIFEENKARYINNIQEMFNNEKKGITEKAILLSSVEHYNRILGESVRNCIFIPLVVGEKKIGVIRAINKQRLTDFADKDFEKYDLEIFKLLVEQIGIAIFDARRQEEKNRYLEDLMHSMKREVQSLFISANKFIMNGAPPKRDKNRNKEALKHCLMEIRNQLRDFELMIKAEDVTDYKFEACELLPLLDEVLRGEKYKIGCNVDLKILNQIKLKIDKKMFQHAFHNLLHNAIQYSITEDMKVSVKGTTHEDFVKIDIINYSVEIPDDEKEAIFRRYYRSEWAKGTFPGAGIGLNTVKKIIDAHKGYIKVLSEKFREKIYKNTFSMFLRISGD